MRSDLYEILAEALGVRVKGTRPLSGGCIGEVYRVDLAEPVGNGGATTVVAKVDGGDDPRLDVEGFMLGYLAEHSALPVPGVLYSSDKLLVMEHIVGDSHFSPGAEAHAADLLAELHGVGSSDGRFGLSRTTLIGALDQPNPWGDSWANFFAESRLLYMAEEGVREGRVTQAVYKRLLKLANRLDDFIDEPGHPSLLHGDVWTTNVLASGDQITGFLDPAVYYGHPEIELAFITLFSTFGQAFFDRYDAQRPIPAGFFQGAGVGAHTPGRRDIYNIYPLVAHARLFGSSYLSGIEHTLGGLGF
jgi:fructosamine-3-kinase